MPALEAEDEILAVVALCAGVALEPAQLVAFLGDRIAYFMVPRYIRFVEALPRTPTQKVEKHRLRATGITDDTWDREAAGIRLERERLTPR